MQAWPRMARSSRCQQHRGLGETFGVRFKARAMACAQRKHVPLLSLKSLRFFLLSDKRDSKSDKRHERMTWMSGCACLPPNDSLSMQPSWRGYGDHADYTHECSRLW